MRLCFIAIRTQTKRRRSFSRACQPEPIAKAVAFTWFTRLCNNALVVQFGNRSPSTLDLFHLKPPFAGRLSIGVRHRILPPAGQKAVETAEGATPRPRPDASFWGPRLLLLALSKKMAARKNTALRNPGGALPRRFHYDHIVRERFLTRSRRKS